MLTDALKRLSKHSLIYALGPAVQKLLGFLLLPLVTAWIGSQAAFGVTEMSAVTLAVAAQVLGINLLHGMTRFYKEYPGEAERRELVSTTFLLLVATTSVGLLAAWLLRERAARWLFGSAEYAPALLVTAGILVAQSASQVGLRWLQVLERSVAYGTLTTLKLVAEIGLKVWFLVGLGLGYMGVLYSVLCGELVIAVGVGGVLLVKSGMRFSAEKARRLARYSYPLLLSGLCMFVLHQSDRYFVLASDGEGDVGLYGLSYKLGSIGNTVLFDAFGLIWFPFIFGVQDPVQRSRVCRAVMVYFTLAITGVSLALALFSREIVTLMADEMFLAAWRGVPIVAAGYVAWSVFQIASTVLYVRERTGVVSLLVAGAAALNLALNAVLVPLHGWLGAAWATVATFTALAGATWIVAERIERVGHEAGRVIGAAGLGLLLYAAGMLGSGFLPEHGLQRVALKLACCAAWPGILWVSGYLKAEEKDKIKSLCREALATAGGRR